MTYEQAHDYEPPAWARYNDGSGLDWSNVNLDLSNSPGNYYNLKENTSPYMLSSMGAFQPSPADLTQQINRVGITPSSGEASEAEDQSPPSNSNSWGNDRPTNNGRQTGVDTLTDVSSPGGDGTPDRHRLSSASSYLGTPQANLLADDAVDHLAIDDFLKQAEAETKRMQMQHQLAQMQVNPQDTEQPSRLSSVSRGITPSISTPGSSGTGEHSYTVREAMRYAHPDGMAYEPYDSIRQPKMEMPASFMTEDPAWSVAPDMTHPELSLDDEREDEDWVR